MDDTGALSLLPTPVLYAIALLMALIGLSGLFIAASLAEGGVLFMALIPLVALCVLRLELRDRSRRRKAGL